jgi:hypothetical protein
VIVDASARWADTGDIKRDIPDKGQKAFREHIAGRYKRERGGFPPTSRADAINGHVGNGALRPSPLAGISWRLARDGNRSTLDLGDPAWQAVEIAAEGWKSCRDRR